ncbi:MAG TPA: hypothetical protein VF773_21080 [Verrucomicrobiae bacterium]
MTKTFSFFAILFLALVTGCVSRVDDRKTVGMPFVKDTIEGRYQRPPAAIFAAAKSVLELNGTLTGENTINNSLEAKVDNRTVVIKVDEVEPGVSRVLIQARKKGGAGDVDLAAELDKQIALKLATGAAR